MKEKTFTVKDIEQLKKKADEKNICKNYNSARRYRFTRRNTLLHNFDYLYIWQKRRCITVS